VHLPAGVKSIDEPGRRRDTECGPARRRGSIPHPTALGRQRQLTDGGAPANGLYDPIYAGSEDSVGIEDYTQPDGRQPLTPAPYAINASNADALGGLPPIAFARPLHDHLGQMWIGTESGVGLWLDGFAALPIRRANNTGAGVSAAAEGVYGETGNGGYFKSTANDAVYAAGDVTVTGDLTVLGAANIASYAQRVTVAKSGAEYATT